MQVISLVDTSLTNSPMNTTLTEKANLSLGPWHTIEENDWKVKSSTWL